VEKTTNEELNDLYPHPILCGHIPRIGGGERRVQGCGGEA